MQVRLLCDRHDHEACVRLLAHHPDAPAAKCHLARSLISLKRVPEAIELFASAGQHALAAKAACRTGMFFEARMHAMHAEKSEQLRVADILLRHGQSDHAAALFQSAGAQVRRPFHDMGQMPVGSWMDQVR
jgi:hypothetical protein